MKIKPLSDYVLLKRERTSTKMDCGLYRPENVTARYQKATVLEVGPGKLSNGTWEQVNLEKEDIVLFDVAGAIDIENTGEENLFLCLKDHIIARFEK